MQMRSKRRGSYAACWRDREVGSWRPAATIALQGRRKAMIDKCNRGRCAKAKRKEHLRSMNYAGIAPIAHIDCIGLEEDPRYLCRI